MLAISFYVWQFMKDNTNKMMVTDVANSWLTHHGLASHNQTDVADAVIRMAETYCSDLGVSMESAFEEMDWEDVTNPIDPQL
jgi:hypothetical protein